MDTYKVIEVNFTEETIQKKLNEANKEGYDVVAVIPGLAMDGLNGHYYPKIIMKINPEETLIGNPYE